MKIFACTIICFLAVASGLKVYEQYPHLTGFSQKRSIMNVMAQVEAVLNNNGPMDAITRILGEFENEIRQE